MKRRLQAGVAGRAILAVATLLLTPSAAVAEETCVYEAPLTADDIQGYTWTGTVVRYAETPRPGWVYQWGVVVFAVDRVYADGITGSGTDRLPFNQSLVAGTRFKVTTNECAGPRDLGMRVGERYLVTASGFLSDLMRPEQTAAWHLEGDRATLVDMYEKEGPGTVIGEPRTLEEALALAAPGSTLPPTDGAAAGVASHAPGVSASFLVASGVLGLWAAISLCRRRYVARDRL